MNFQLSRRDDQVEKTVVLNYKLLLNIIKINWGHQKSTGYRNQQKFPVPCTFQDLPTKSRKVQARGTGDLQKM